MLFTQDSERQTEREKNKELRKIQRLSTDHGVEYNLVPMPLLQINGSMLAGGRGSCLGLGIEMETAHSVTISGRPRLNGSCATHYLFFSGGIELSPGRILT